MPSYPSTHRDRSGGSVSAACPRRPWRRRGSACSRSSRSSGAPALRASGGRGVRPASEGPIRRSRARPLGVGFPRAAVSVRDGRRPSGTLFCQFGFEFAQLCLKGKCQEVSRLHPLLCLYCRLSFILANNSTSLDTRFLTSVTVSQEHRAPLR